MCLRETFTTRSLYHYYNCPMGAYIMYTGINSADALAARRRQNNNKHNILRSNRFNKKRQRFISAAFYFPFPITKFTFPKYELHLRVRFFPTNHRKQSDFPCYMNFAIRRKITLALSDNVQIYFQEGEAQ